MDYISRLNDMLKSKHDGKQDESDFMQKLRRQAGYDDSYSKVDQSYVNSFVRDSQGYLSNMQENTKRLSGSNATKEYENYSSRLSDLRSKADNIRSYYNAHKKEMDEQFYQNMIDYLDEFDTSSNTLFDFYRESSEKYNRGSNQKGSEPFDKNNFKNPIDVYQFLSSKDYTNYTDKEIDKEFDEAMFYIGGAKERAEKSAEDVQAVTDPSSVLTGLPRQKRVQEELLNFNNAKPNTVEVENENKNFRDVLNDIQNTKNKNALKNNLSSAVGNIENHKPNQELLSPLEISQNRVNELNDIYQNTLALKNQKKQDKYMTMANEDENFAAYVQEAKTEVDWDQDKISEIKSHPKYQRVYNQVELAFSNRDKNLNLNISDLAPEYLLTMSEDERNTYDYHYITGGKHTADQYLDTIKEELKQRQGKIEAEELLNEKGPIARTAYAGKASIDAAISEIKGIPNALHLSYDPMERTESEYAYQNMRQELSGTEAIISDLVYNTGRMTPSIAASLVNPKLGLAVAGLQSASAAYDSAVSEGYSPNEALAYGTANGISESLSQYLLGGINAFGNSAVGKAIGKTKLTSQLDDITKKLIKNPVARQRLLNIAKYGTEMHSEGMEEYFQEIIDPLVRNITLGEDNELSLVNEDAAYAYLLGALTAGTLNAPYAALNESSLRSEGRKIKSSGEEQQTIQRGLESDQGSKAWELAQEISRKQTNRETPSNYEIGLLENALNEADVQIGPEQTQEVSNEVGNQESYAQTQTRLTEMGVDKEAAAVQAKAIERLKLGDDSAVHTILESPEAKQLLARDTGVVFGTTPEQGRRAAGEIAARAQSQAGRIRQEIQPEQAASTVRQNDQQQTDTSAMQPMDHMTERETATAILPAESPALQPQTASAQQGFVPDPVMESGQSAPLKTVSEVRKPQAVWADSGEPVQVTGIQSAQNGELYVRADSDSGSTVVRASDLSYQSPEVELIYQTAAQLGTSGAKAFVYGYQPGSSFDSYYKGFMRAYHAGTANTPFEQIGSAYTAMLPKETARRAYYAGQNDQTERFTNAGERSTIKTKQVKDVTYTYQAVPEGRRSENAGTIVRELELLGLGGEAIEPGLQVRQNGKMRTSQGDASTLKDGHVVVRNDTDANPKNAAAHEAFHAWRNLKLPEANAYFDAVTDGNIDFSSESFNSFSKEIIQNYFDESLSVFDIVENQLFQHEFAAFVSGALYEDTTGIIQSYPDMFYDWEMVETAWQKMIEAGKGRKQDGQGLETDRTTLWMQPQKAEQNVGREGTGIERSIENDAEKTGRTPEAERGRPRSIPQVEREGRPGNEGISGQRSLLGLESSEAERGAGKRRKQDGQGLGRDYGSQSFELGGEDSENPGRRGPMAGNGEIVAEGTGRTPEAESGRPRSIPQVEREGRPGNEGIYGQRSLLGLESSETERGAGKGQQGQTTGLAQNEAAKKLKGSQRAYLHVLGKLSNSRIVLDDTIQGGRANGYYDLDTGEIHIALDAVDSAYDFVAKHELTHQLQQLSPEHYRQYFDHVVSYLNQAEPDAFDKLVQKQLDGYREMGKKITRQQAMDEVVADASDAFLRDSAAIRDLVSQNRTLGQKVLDAIRSMIRKIDQYLRTHKTLHTDAARLLSRNKKALEEAQRLWTNALLSAQKNTVQQKSSTGGNVRFSIKRDADGSRYVQVDEDILEGVPQKDWTKTIKTVMSRRFSNGIPISGRLIKVNKISKNEFTNSKNTQYYRKNKPDVYQDKLTAAGSLDEIVLASTDYINEDLMHSRKDNFKQFARGNVTIRVGRNKYDAKVIVGFTSGNQMVLYDIVDFKRKKIDALQNTVQSQNKVKNSSASTSITTNIPQEDTGVNDSISQNDKNVRFSLKGSQGNQYDYSKSFAEQIDDYKAGKIPKGDTLVVGSTSDVFQKIGLNPLPMTYSIGHLKDVLKGNKPDHNFGETVLKQLPNAIKNPVAVIASQTQKNTSIVALLPIQYKGKTMIAPAYIDGFGFQNGIQIDSNAITSVHTRGNAVTKLLNDAIQEERNGKTAVYYYNKKIADPLLHVAGLQLPGGLIPHGGYIHSIREKGSPVNNRLENVTYSQQFKRWFGDWEKHPNTASKVVNKDSTPRVMYQDLRVENSVKKKDGSGLRALGKGNYFTSQQLNGSSVVKAYLDLKNPFVYQQGALDLKAQFANASQIDTTHMNHSELQQAMKDAGYDGVIQYTSNENMIAVAFDSTQIKSATDNIGTFDGNNPDIRFSLKNVSKLESENLIERYTQTEYNDYGWVAVNEVLTPSELRKLNTQFADIMHGEKFSKNKDGYYIIPVGEENKPQNSFVFIKGTISHPKIAQVIRIDVRSETELDVIRSVFHEHRMDTARKIAEDYFGQETVFRFAASDFGNYREIQGEARSLRRNAGSNRGVSDGGRDQSGNLGSLQDKDQVTFSLKNVSKLDYDNLIKENKKQKEMISLLEEQFQVTKGIKWDKASIDRTAQRILKQYDSAYSVQDLSENLTSLYGYLKNNPDTNTDEVHSVVTAMSKSVLEHSRKLDDAMYQEYKELRDRIRGTRLTLSDADKADLDRAGGYHQFRRDNFGRLNLTNQGIPVDVFYQELQTLYPEFFAGEEITHPADQLIRIAEVLDTIRPVYVNPYGMNLDEAAGVLANELLESYVDIPQAKPTYADRELQKRKKLKLEYQKKIREIKAEYKAKYEEKLKEVNRQNILNIRKIQEQLKKTAAADRETIKKLERQVERLKKYNQNITHAKTAAMSVSPVTSVSVPVKKSDSSVPMKQVISAAPSYVEAAKQYGTIPKGEGTVGDVAVPAQTGETILRSRSS